MATKPCLRPRPHGPHQWVPGPKSIAQFDCPGLLSSDRGLAELLFRRPELVGMTAPALRQQMEVMSA